MGSKTTKRNDKYSFDLYDDLDDFYDDDADLKELTRGAGNTNWEEFFDTDAQMTARRNIERRRDYMKLRSELDEWEQFGDSAGW